MYLRFGFLKIWKCIPASLHLVFIQYGSSKYPDGSPSHACLLVFFTLLFSWIIKRWIISPIICHSRQCPVAFRCFLLCWMCLLLVCWWFSWWWCVLAVSGGCLPTADRPGVTCKHKKRMIYQHYHLYFGISWMMIFIRRWCLVYCICQNRFGNAKRIQQKLKWSDN